MAKVARTTQIAGNESRLHDAVEHAMGNEGVCPTRVHCHALTTAHMHTNTTEERLGLTLVSSTGADIVIAIIRNGVAKGVS